MSASSHCDTIGWMRRILLAPWAGWILAGMALLFSALNVTTAFDLDQGNDLRNRIVGARALAQGLDPYNLEALAGNAMPPPALTDPFSWELGFSATTASPLILTFYSLAMNGEWNRLHLFWTVLEWTAFVLAIVLTALCAPTRRMAGWLAFLLIGLFGFSAIWLLHVWIGQYYVFVAFLIALEAYLLHRRPAVSAFAGISLGLASVFRPFILVIVPALWILNLRRPAIVACLLGASLAGLSVMTAPALWASYARLTETWIAFYAIPPADRPPSGPHNAEAIALAAQDGYIHRISPGLGPTLLQERRHGTGLNETTARWREIAFSHNWKRVTLSVLAVIGGGLSLLALTRRRFRREETSLAIVCCAPLLADIAVPVATCYNLVMTIPAVGYVLLTAMRLRLWICLPALLPLWIVLRTPSLVLNMVGIVILVLIATFGTGPLLLLQQRFSTLITPRQRR